MAKFFIHLFALLLFTPSPALASDQILLMSDMAGTIERGLNGNRFISLNENVRLAIDPLLLVKGDRLDVFAPADKKSNDASAIMRKIGSIVVLSGSNQPPTGKLTRARREVFGDAYIGFHLPETDQVNPFLPFLRSIADTYIERPQSDFLRVAIIDVINQYGQRTQAGDLVFDKLLRSVCARPQFDCVDRKKIVESLWRHKIKTSRGLNSAAVSDLQSSTGADFVITGHLRYSQGAVDLALRAETASPKRRPNAVWRRFHFSPDQLDILSAESFGKITGEDSGNAATGRLVINLVSPLTVEGMEADHFFYKKLTRSEDSAGADAGFMAAYNYFLTVDGNVYPMNLNGEFYNGAITQGYHRVTFGYYPALKTDGGKIRPLAKPFKSSIDIFVNREETHTLNITGKIENGYSVIVTNSSSVPRGD